MPRRIFAQNWFHICTGDFSRLAGFWLRRISLFLPIRSRRTRFRSNDVHADLFHITVKMVRSYQLAVPPAGPGGAQSHRATDRDDVSASQQLARILFSLDRQCQLFVFRYLRAFLLGMRVRGWLRLVRYNLINLTRVPIKFFSRIGIFQILVFANGYFVIDRLNQGGRSSPRNKSSQERGKTAANGSFFSTVLPGAFFAPKAPTPLHPVNSY